MLDTWAGGYEVPIQNVAQHSTLDPAHGVLDVIIGYIPGGAWSLLGFAGLGVGTVVWWKTHAVIESWIRRVVSRPPKS